MNAERDRDQRAAQDHDQRAALTERSSRVRRLSSLALVVLLALLAGRSLLADGFYPAHDNLLNVHRLFEMDRCFEDGQIPCRWAPDMAFGYGVPIFNYYPPLPTLVGEFYLALGSSHIEAVKSSMLLALVLAGLGMFLLGQSLYGDWGGIACAALYVWAPYFAIDVFVRGALAETWGLALLPWLFVTGARTIFASSLRSGWGLASSIVGGALLLSHPLTVLMAAPAYACWIGWMLWRTEKHRRPRAIAWLAAAHALALLIAAHSVLPAFAERDLVHLDNLTTQYEWNRYENNFLSAAQVLTGSLPWGFGALGTPDRMSLFVGRAHWMSATAIGIGLIATRRRRDRATAVSPADTGAQAMRDAGANAALFGGVVGWAAVAMTLPATATLWAMLPPLEYLQFPWRFLGLASFGFSLAAGGALALASIAPTPSIARSRGAELTGWRAVSSIAIALALACAAVAINWSYFRVSAMHEIPNHKLASAGNVARMRHGALDYLPIAAEVAAFDRMPDGRDTRVATIVSGEGHQLRGARRTSDAVHFRVEPRRDPTAAISATGSAGSIVRINTIRFPGWRVRVNGSEVEFAQVADPLGRIHVALPEGAHELRATFEDTAVRRTANALSLLGALAWVAWAASNAIAFRHRNREERAEVDA